jgi:gas vesicle protein
MSDRDEFGAFFVGFLVGAVSGAVVALLFAPQSGEETRAIIGERSIELRDKAVEGGKQVYGQASEAAGKYVGQAEDYATKVVESAKKTVARKPAEPAADQPSISASSEEPAV